MVIVINKSAANRMIKWNDFENSQHVFSEAPLPFSLVEEVVEVAAKGDEDKAKSEESEYTWRGETEQRNQMWDTTSIPVDIHRNRKCT